MCAGFQRDAAGAIFAKVCFIASGFLPANPAGRPNTGKKRSATTRFVFDSFVCIVSADVHPESNFSVSTVRGDDFNVVGSQFCIEAA